MPLVSKFISGNWKWLLTAIAAAGVTYNQFDVMRRDMEVVKRRQQTYIEQLKAERQYTHQLEIRVAILETKMDIKND